MNFTPLLKKLGGVSAIYWSNATASLLYGCVLHSPHCPQQRSSCLQHWGQMAVDVFHPAGLPFVNCPCQWVSLLPFCCRYLFSSVITKLLKSSQIVLFVPSSTYTLSLGPASLHSFRWTELFIACITAWEPSNGCCVQSHIQPFICIYWLSTVLEVSWGQRLYLSIY